MEKYKMCISNFHTHTKLCKHATGMPVDYIQQAEKDGCLALGFSDHCPYPEHMPDHWPEIRMSFSETSEYISSVRAASVKAPFPVYLGFECEWDSGYRNWYSDMLSGNFGADFLVLGAHWLTSGTRHLYVQNLESAKDLNTYVNQTIAGMQSGLFRYLAHPDLFMGGWKEWDEEAESCLRALMTAAAGCHMPIEINGYGMVKEPVMTSRGERFQYPVEEFWQIVSDSKVEVICNSDAHTPEVVIANARLARAFADKFGISPVETIF